MSIGLSTAIAILLFLLGGASLIIPASIAKYFGIAMLLLSVLVGVWTLWGYLHLKRLAKLIGQRVHINFINANFDAIGMSSPYVDFYFNIRNCLPHSLISTGQKRGHLWNPCIEAWRSSWESNLHTDVHIIRPDENTILRVRWVVPQGYNSPMSEFAFRAKDNPPEQKLTFEDMGIELKARFLGIERKMGWLQLAGVTDISIPDHTIFETVRKEYNRQKS